MKKMIKEKKKKKIMKNMFIIKIELIKKHNKKEK